MTAGRVITSLNKDWCTPAKYVTAIREFFESAVDLDPCSNQHSIVHAKLEYRLPRHDGLFESWHFPKIYVNPPYGADRERGTTIKNWLKKCAEANRKYGSEVLALVPVATNTSHWKLYVWGVAAAVAFLYDETRLKFLENGKNGGKGAPMSCAMVYWGVHLKRFDEVFTKFGAVVELQSLHGKTLGLEDRVPLFHTADVRG